MDYRIINPLSLDSKYSEHVKSGFSIVDLPELIEKLKEDNNRFAKNISVLFFFNSPGKQILLTAFREGTKFNSFHSTDSITFHVMEGRISFHTSKESSSLGNGQLLKLQENIPYSITSYEDTLLLVTIETEK